VERELTPLTASECAYCGGPIPARKRRDSRYCSTAHRVLGNRKARREAAVHESLVAMQGSEFTDHESLTDAYERSAEFARPDASYVVPDASDDDETGIHGDEAGHDDDSQSWSASISLQSQLDNLLAGYDRRARPFLATQARNQGVVLPQLVQLKREYAAMAQRLIDDRERTSAMERADRTRGLRIERASDRAAGQRAMHEFARDLHRRGIDLPNAGRATSDIMGLRESSDPFSRSDREMYGSSAIARNMMSSGFGSFPGDMRSWR
jgi:hypothetical protein